MTLTEDDPGVWPDDHAAAAALVETHLPGDARAALSPAGEGDFCLAFRRGGSIVRVARHRKAADALRREACAMAGIAAHLPLPVPRPSFHEPAPGRAFSIHAEITGEALTREDWEGLPDAAREASASDLARFLGVLHDLPASIGASCGVPRLDAAEYAARLLPACGSLRPLLCEDTFRRLREALERWSRPPADADRQAALLHCDVAPGHVLFDPASGRLTGVIDFGDLAIGDPARDFVYVYEDFGPEMLGAVLRHYAGEDSAALPSRIRAWFVLETVEWTLGQQAEEEPGGVEEGLAVIAHELDALDA